MSDEIKLIGICFLISYTGSVWTFELLGIKTNQKTALLAASISAAIFALLSLIVYVRS